MWRMNEGCGLDAVCGIDEEGGGDSGEVWAAERQGVAGYPVEHTKSGTVLVEVAR